MVPNFQARGLRRASRLYGEHQVRAILQVSPETLQRWTQGEETIPVPLFLRVVNLLAAAEAGL